MKLDECESLTRPNSFRENKLKEMKFPLKRDVLFDFLKKYRLEKILEEYGEDDRGALFAWFNNNDVFRIWASEYESYFSGVRGDPNIIVYEESVLYKGEGIIGEIDTKGNPLQAKITKGNYAERTKIGDFNLIPFCFERYVPKKRKKEYVRKIERIDDHHFHFLIGKKELRVGSLDRKDFKFYESFL